MSDVETERTCEASGRGDAGAGGRASHFFRRVDRHASMRAGGL